ncbi:CLUMA_CG013444, isoform B [Clunio marinus]|nr:CLUMA_CG013444, isoform B [Clunio marinus]
MRWNFHSTKALDKTEEKMLSGVKTQYNKFYVDIGQCVGDDDKIWTLSMNTENNSNIPMVLLHGFGAGIGFWILNFDAFAAERPIYAIDLLGYGKSSRPKFSKDAEIVENQYVETIEKWRQFMRIDKMIILGHSFGGFISASYSIKYPERIEHLILGDPWGFTPAPDLKQYSLYKRSLIRASGVISPLWIVRAAGPLGPVILRKGRPDIVEKYENVVDKHDRTIAKYVYHCNTKKTTGELAFRNLLDVGAYPKRPMLERLLNGLKENIPMTIIFGEESWIDNSFGPELKNGRSVESYTQIENIKSAGHQLFSDNAEEFNRIVLEACKVLKSNKA